MSDVTPPAMLAAVTEINSLRDEVARLTEHSLALNAVLWYLATELDLVSGNVTAVTYAPMEIARMIVAQRDEFDRLLQEKP